MFNESPHPYRSPCSDSLSTNRTFMLRHFPPTMKFCQFIPFDEIFCRLFLYFGQFSWFFIFTSSSLELGVRGCSTILSAGSSLNIVVARYLLELSFGGCFKAYWYLRVMLFLPAVSFLICFTTYVQVSSSRTRSKFEVLNVSNASVFLPLPVVFAQLSFGWHLCVELLATRGVSVLPLPRCTVHSAVRIRKGLRIFYHMICMMRKEGTWVFLVLFGGLPFSYTGPKYFMYPTLDSFTVSFSLFVVRHSEVQIGLFEVRVFVHYAECVFFLFFFRTYFQPVVSVPICSFRNICVHFLDQHRLWISKGPRQLSLRYPT